MLDFSEYNPIDQTTTMDEPSPVFGDARERCPVVHSDALDGFWALFNYSDIAEVARKPLLYCSREGVKIPRQPTPVVPPIEIDPPHHKQFRSPVADRFSRVSVSKMEPTIRTTVRSLIATFIDRGHADLAQDLAIPMPAITAMDFFEIPPAKREAILPNLIRAAQAPDDFAAWLPCLQFFDALYDEPAEQGDIARAVSAIEVDGRPITKDEYVAMMLMVVGAGLDTTASGAANSIAIFGRRPDLRAELIANPDRIPAAVEEMLRYITPLTTLVRTTTAGVELNGVAIPAGERVQLNWLAANHDPKEFDQPDEIRFDRPHYRHFAFGTGPHRCLGAHLARLQLRVLFEELLGALPDFEVIEDGIVRNGGLTRGISALPVTFPVRAREALVGGVG